MLRHVPLLHTIIFSCASGLALDQPSFRGKLIADALERNQTHVRVPCEDCPQAPSVDRVRTDFFYNSTGSQNKVETNREQIVCHLKALIDLALVPAVSEGGANLQAAITEHGWMHRTCAVVSSSGIMRWHEHGERIDSAQLVLRFNDAPLKGYEHLVGHKDMVRFENMHWAQRVLDGELVPDPQIIIINVLNGGVDHQWSWTHLAKQRPDLQMFQVPEQMVRKLENALRNLFDKAHFAGPNTLPTSGAMGMLLSLAMCSKVEAFGMAMSDKAVQLKDKIAYHYYEDGGQASGNNWHQSFTPEKHLWRYLGSDPLLVDTQEISTIDIPETGCVH